MRLAKHGPKLLLQSREENYLQSRRGVGPIEEASKPATAVRSALSMLAARTAPGLCGVAVEVQEHLNSPRRRSCRCFRTQRPGPQSLTSPKRQRTYVVRRRRLQALTRWCVVSSFLLHLPSLVPRKFPLSHHAPVRARAASNILSDLKSS